jgi:hypothetical protein
MCPLVICITAFTTTITLDRIIVEPDGHLTVKLKAYEDLDRLLAKHRQLIEAQKEQRKVS